jgi:hypothetical protein
VRIALLVFLCVLSAGCDTGPAQGTVSGTVTLDGQSVDGGLIRFVPADGNTQPADSVITGSAYSVTMPIGEKKVEVYWAPSSGKAADTATQGTEQIVQRIPAKYNAQTTLSYALVKGKQTRDFALTSK